MRYLFILLFFAYCTPPPSDQDKAAALVRADVLEQGMGIVKNVEVLNLEAFNDSTYRVRYSIDDPFNPSHRKEIELTYFFDSELEQVKKTEQ